MVAILYIIRRVKQGGHVMLQRIREIPSFLRGEFIVLKVDKQNDKLTVDAGNTSPEELKTVANTLFKKAYRLSNLSRVSS